ncbi:MULTISPECIES: formylglycine-generating enzyme family protein [Rhodococcus]|uniref:formylglycine-generating enzyme family protein n=2 Tax=Nocardiaceae TaxID=85025 RepID=UPI00049278E2|nr:SUMF1/EgtB/PvdO family nonheme iron enzyme [Rhodococcus erythropolis]
MTGAAELMIEIPAGEVHLRDDRKGTAWTSKVESFRLARHLTTRALLDGDSADDPSKPAVDLSWKDVIATCNTLSVADGLSPAYHDIDTESPRWDRAATGYRLATEAEWQYACKAGTSGYRYGEIDEIAWYSDNSEGRAHDVGMKAPNNWGLYDMIGNVWEWCWDLYDPEVYGTYRIFRGGSWAESERGCGATVRRRSHPTFAIDDLGFRLAQTI